MKRAYYSKSIKEYLLDSESSILGELTASHSNRTLEELQINAWRKQILILKEQLKNFEGQIYFEFAIPRMGKRVDNIVIINDVVFVIEFKVGDGGYEKYAIEQAIDYTIDLKNFHEGSHHSKLIPVLVATNAENYTEPISNVINHNSVAKSNQHNIADTLKTFINYNSKPINIED